MKREIALTNDGSSSIFIPEMNEHYHSHNGAIQEAKHVFFKNGLDKFQQDNIKVFEVGFGTGLNALLAAGWSQRNNINLDYDSIEAFPVDADMLDKLNYTELIDDSVLNWKKIHEANWDKKIEINSCFKLKKIHSKIQNYNLEQENYDVVFFDAFGPRAQSEMWGGDILNKMYDTIKYNGKLVTYCAQGQFKRDLKSLGFTVTSFPGPPGKREMTVAIKSEKGV